MVLVFRPQDPKRETLMLRLMTRTLTDPKTAWQQVTGYGLGRRDMVLALAALSAIAAILAWLYDQILPVPPEMVAQQMQIVEIMQSKPFLSAFVQFAMSGATVMLLYHVGRFLGGTGSLDQSLLAVVWQKAILIALQGIQLLVALVSIQLLGFLSIIELGISIYLAIRLTQLVHGFQNPLMVLLGMTGTFMALGFALAILITTLGLSVAGIQQ